MLKIPEHWIFARNRNSYNIGDEVLSCWTDFALNKNSPQRYKKFKAVIKNVNANGTYSVEFSGIEKHHSDCVREMWITTESEQREHDVTLEHWHEDPISSLCIQVASKWTPQCVATFLVECSHEAKIDLTNSIRMVLKNIVGGGEFTSLNQGSLVSVLGMSSAVAKDFYERFMYWVHTRMDNPPINAQRKRERMNYYESMNCDNIPGGGLFLSRMS